MEGADLYLRLAVALAIGLGVGIERGWRQRDEPSGEREAGVRTFSIIALTGAGAGLSVEPIGAWFAAAVGLGFGALIAVIYFVSVHREDSDRGATTEAAALLTFVAGALSGAGQMLAAGLLGTIMIALLDLKDELHQFLRRVQEYELTAAIKLLLVTVILLPVLPDQGYGPGGVLNPRELWFVVVLIATLGFVGYAGLKTAGPQAGALFLGVVGGLMSSTAVTVGAAQASKSAPQVSSLLAGSVAAAQTVMFARVAVVLAALNVELLRAMMLPLLVGAAVTAGTAFVLFARASEKAKHAEIPSGSPDTLIPAIKFVAMVAVALLAGYYAQTYLGGVGVMLSGLLVGAFDVDAATVSASRLSMPGVGATSIVAASGAVILAIFANSVVKALMGFTQGTRELAWRAAIALIASALAMLLAFAGMSVVNGA